MTGRLLAAALAAALAGCAPGDAVESPLEGPGTGATDVPAPPPTVDRPDWASAFEAEGAVGTFVLYDPATGRTERLDAERAATRFTPASTSKVFNALVFLDRGAVRDPDSVSAWDGVERSVGAWNRDHSLRSGTEVSAAWLFQRLAREVGRDGYEEVFARQSYGNSTMGEPLEMSWLDGTWRVSADEQVAFVDALRRGALAFDAADQATVRDLLPVLDEGLGWRLKGKTGWGQCCDRPDIGWIVGYLERPQGDLVFAMNAEAAQSQTFEVGPGRLRIVRAVLGGEGLLPRDGG